MNPFCPFCERESDSAKGFCNGCEQFVHDHHLKPVEILPGTVGEIMERFSWQAPYEELRRTGTGGWQ